MDYADSTWQQEDTALTPILAKYKQQLDRIHSILDTMHDVRRQEESIVGRLWKWEPIITTLKGKCGDGNEVMFEHEGHHVTFQSAESRQLNDVMQCLRSEINTNLYRLLFEARMTRVATQTLIDDTLWSIHHRSNATTTTNSSAIQKDLSALRQMLGSLFAAVEQLDYRHHDEEEVEEDEQEIASQEVSAFVKDVRTWIIHVSSIYLHLAPLADRGVLLAHLLHMRGGIQWAMPLVQYTYEPSNDHDRSLFMQEYIGALRLLLDPAMHHDPPPWIEDDYLACIDQFAILHVYDSILSDIFRKPSIHADSKGLERLFTFSEELTAVLNTGIQAFANKNHTNLIKRLAQCVCRISQKLANRLQGQEHMDKFMVKVVDGFLAIQDPSVWQFLPTLPFHAVSIETLCKIAKHVLDIREYDMSRDYKHIFHHLPDITQLLSFLANNHVQGIFLLGCLCSIVVAIPRDATRSTDTPLPICLITVIAHALFTVAFLDTNIRDMYYKDVRDNFGTICSYHPFTISLLLRWTTAHFTEMEGNMAMYLFRSLPIHHWKVLKEDLVSLHELLCGNKVQHGDKSTHTPQAMFARFVFEHINLDYGDEEDETLSKSQPWHSRRIPFQPYEIHEELAFLLLDACQVFHPLPDSDHKNDHLIKTVGVAVSSYLPSMASRATFSSASPSNNDNMIEWAWRMTMKLKLYDCPISSRASDIDASITGVFLREMLHTNNDITASHAALVVYVALLLSATSRHFLRFECGSGWDKMLLVLRRSGKPESVVYALSDIIPAFVYMHGDDLFNDSNLYNFTRQMLDFKSDPMLATHTSALIQKTTHDPLFLEGLNGVSMMVATHIWQGTFIDSTVMSEFASEDGGGGFSYRDLILHSWLKTIFQRHDWMWNEHHVAIMDYICKVAFSLQRHDLVEMMLGEEHKRLLAAQRQKPRKSTSTPTPRSPKKQEQQQNRNPLRMIKNILPDIAYSSLLAGEWSLTSITTGNLFRAPGVEQHYLWFAFHVLMLETVQDQELRRIFGQQCCIQESEDIDVSAVFKDISDAKPVEFLSPYRWLQHVLICPPDHPLMPLFLQSFFSIYYASIEVDGKRVFYGAMLFSRKQELIERLRDRIAFLQTFHGQRRSSAGDPSNDHHETMRQTYYAMWLWLDRDADILSTTFDISTLPAHYCPERLASCRQFSTPKDDEKDWEPEQPWHKWSNLWLDLVDVDSMEKAFKDFPWPGTEKYYVEHPDFPPRPGMGDDNSSISHRGKQSMAHHTADNITKAAPEYQPKKPAQRLTSTELLSATAESLIGTTVRTMGQHAEKFYGHLERQRILDADYIDKVSNLYTNTTQTEHVEAKCARADSNHNDNCSRPASWDVDASRVETDKAIERALKENRQESDKLVFRSVDATVCIQALITFHKFDAIVEQAKQKSNKRPNNALIHLGWSCLAYVLDHLTHETRDYPPFRTVVHHMSKLLGEAVADEPQYIDRFFSLVDNDKDRVLLVYPAFRPHADNKRLVATFDRVRPLNSPGQLKLLPLFDMVAWSTTSYATESMRQQFYTKAFNSLQQAVTQGDEQLCKKYTDMVFALMMQHIATRKQKRPEQIKVLDGILNLLADSRDSACDARIMLMDTFTAQLGGNPSEAMYILHSKSGSFDGALHQLTRDGVISCLDFLAESFMSTKHLFSTYGDASPALCRLLVCLLNDNRLIQETRDDTTLFMWRYLGHCFHPWWRQDYNDCNDLEFTTHTGLFLRAYHDTILNFMHDNSIDKAQLLGWLFAYYHEKLLLREQHGDGGWLERFGNTISDLAWKHMDINTKVLQRIRQTWALVRNNRRKRIAYLHFIWHVLSPWINSRPVVHDTQQRLHHVEMAFIFVKDADAIWSDDGERLESLDLTWRSLGARYPDLPTQSIATLTAEFKDDWHGTMQPLEADKVTGMALAIAWVRNMTRFSKPNIPMRQRRIFVDFVMALLAVSNDNDSDDGLRIRHEWVQHLYEVIDAHAPEDSRGMEFDEMVLVLSNLAHDLDGSITSKTNRPCTLVALFAAFARSGIITKESTQAMEQCIEQHLHVFSTSPSWQRLGELLASANADYSLLLQHSLDNGCMLMVCVYIQAKERTDPLASLAEEAAAIISIAKPDRKTVHLVRMFATLFQQARDQEQRLLASIVSLSRTASRWKAQTMGEDWHVFAVLLDSFIGSRLQARGVLSPIPSPSSSSADGWITPLEKMKKDKKYKPYADSVNQGIETVKDHDRWTIWDLEQAIDQFGQVLEQNK